MKPCSSNKESIALHAAAVLDEPALQRLMAHLETCPGCREYLRELRAIAQAHLLRAEKIPAPRDEGAFHRLLQERIGLDDRTGVRDLREGASSYETQNGGMRAWGFLRRAGLIFVPAAAAVAILIWVVNRPAPPAKIAPALLPAAVVVAPKPVPVEDPAANPSLLAYRKAALESLEVLEAVLARDERRLLPQERAVGLRDVL